MNNNSGSFAKKWANFEKTIENACERLNAGKPPLVTEQPLPVQLADTRDTRTVAINAFALVIAECLVTPTLTRLCLKALRSRYSFVSVLSRKDVLLARFALAGLLPMPKVATLLQPYVKRLGG